MVRLLRGYKIRRLDSCIADVDMLHISLRSPRPPKTAGVSSLRGDGCFPVWLLRRGGETRTKKITYNGEVATWRWFIRQQPCLLAT